jgi:GTPase
MQRILRFDWKQYHRLCNSRFSSSRFLSSEPSLSHEEKGCRRRRLDVAIVGLPNAGKSQLLNVLTGATVSAVSRKRHTTRQGVMGERTVNDAQLLFLDTPGFLRRSDAKREGLPDGRHLSELTAYVPNVDHTILVVDAAKKLTDGVSNTLMDLMMLALQAKGRDEASAFEGDSIDDIDIEYQTFSSTPDRADNDREDGDISTATNSPLRVNVSEPSLQPKFSVVLNKVDLVHPKSKLLDVASQIEQLAERCLQRHAPTNIQDRSVHDLLPMFFYTSALKQEGTHELLFFLLDRATPCDEFEIDPGSGTDMTPEERVQEIVREKIYRCLHKEVPYRIEQRNTLFRVVTNPNAAGDIRGIVVHQELVVRSRSHVELVRGSGGRTLERIRESAQRDLERIYNCQVVLQLHIKYSRSKS